MSKVILFNKPYKVLTQFTDNEGGRDTLKQFIDAPGFYPAGRLDYLSEGLLVLVDDGALQQRITAPALKMRKTYQVQVEGQPSAATLARLRRGVELKDGLTRPCEASAIAEPRLWPRSEPVIAHRAANSSWLEVTLTEGRNRQLRRMLAQLGHPVLRLVRTKIGPWRLDSMQAGEMRWETVHLPRTSKRQQSRLQ